MKVRRNIWFLLLSVVFISLFSPTTSPFYPFVEQLDSCFFQVVGWNWANGGVAYLTAWDQKGPVIYFINMLGYLLFGSKVGVWLLQVVSLFLTLHFTYRFLREEFEERRATFLTSLSVFALLNDYASSGNNVEEYLLPLLVPSFWCIYRWTKQRRWPNENTTHNPCFAFLYGVTFAFGLYTRLTNVLALCGAIAVIFFVLVYHREWKNILYNMLAFVGGFLLLFLPFAIYFYNEGAFDEMWYATYGYNVEYASIAPDLDPWSVNRFLYLLKSAILCFVLVFVSLLMVFHSPQRRLAGFLWLIADCSCMDWLMTGNGFNHYFIITFPFYSISLCELRKLWSLKGKMIYGKMVVVFLSLLVLACTYELYGTYKGMTTPDTNISFYTQVKKDIGTDKSKTFLAWNSIPSIYLFLNRQPGMRFLSYQESQISFSRTLKPKVVASFLQTKPYWVLICYGGSAIEKILEKDYVLCKSYKGGQKLYRKL